MRTDAWCKPYFSFFGKKSTNTCSYITNISPQYILAVTETAPWHQVESLRDALWKHLASQTSIKVVLVSLSPVTEFRGFSYPILTLIHRLASELSYISSGIPSTIPFVTKNSSKTPLSETRQRQNLDRLVVLEAPEGEVTTLWSHWSADLLCYCRVR